MAKIRYESHAKEVKERLYDAVDRYLKEAGMHLEGEAKLALEANPRRIDTGLLRNSITHALYGEGANISGYTADKPKNGEVESGTYSGSAPGKEDGRAVYIGTNVEYAMYVHEGTSKMAPNRFIKNSIEWNKEQLKAKAEEIIGGKMAF